LGRGEDFKKEPIPRGKGGGKGWKKIVGGAPGQKKRARRNGKTLGTVL